MKNVFFCVLLVLASCVFSVGQASATDTASKFTVLYSFPSTGLGGLIPSNLILDSEGNLYGTSVDGGLNPALQYGVVFELSPTASGWQESVLYSFNGAPDGGAPDAGLVMDAGGNLYGTTTQGGTGNCTLAGIGCGTVFELSPQGNGHWAETILYSFQGGDDGTYPEAGLVFDTDGNLYGTTTGTGGNGSGTAFELSPVGGGWVETVLHIFPSGTNDGQYPSSGLTFDAMGNIYGTTYYGGPYNNGTVFQLQPPTPNGGTWSENVLDVFGPAQAGEYPNSTLVFDRNGNLFGANQYGGGPGGGGGRCGTGKSQWCGVVFELTPGSDGGWTQSDVHRFIYNDTVKDGAIPRAGVVLDANGSLWGTTEFGGAHDSGTVFRLTPNAKGGWIENLYSFCAKTNCSDGANPVDSVVVDPSGNVYGTTLAGGTSNAGVVFEVTP